MYISYNSKRRSDYYMRYGHSELTKYFLNEYKSVDDAEAHLLTYYEGNKFDLLKYLKNKMEKIIHFINKDREKEMMENFLSQAKDHVDLEMRQKQWERKSNQRYNFLMRHAA